MRYTTTLLAVMLLCCCRQKKTTTPHTTTPDPLTITTEMAAKAARESAALLSNSIGNGETAAQKFTVKLATTLTARKGLRVTVNPAHLCTQDGRAVTGPVEVEIKELTNAMDMLLANAPTVSNGRLLESGGAYYIGMKSGGEALKLRAGNRLAIQLPKRTPKGMELFYGERTTEGAVNWKPAYAKFTVQTASTGTEDTRFNVRYRNTTRRIKTGDSITVRPLNMWECSRIYTDSVKKARFAYGIANRHRLSHRQEMYIYLQPVEFPFERFRKNIRDYARFPESGRIDFRNSLSMMYTVPDTVPIYKEVPYTAPVAGEAIAIEDNEELDYYRPTEIDSLGWINCDRFTDDIPISKNINIQLPDSTKMDACKVYYIFNNINSVLAEGLNDSRAFSKIPVRSLLPENAALTVIVVGVSNSKLYFGRTQTRISSNQVIHLPLQPMRGSSLATALKA